MCMLLFSPRTSLHFTSKQNHFAYISRQFTSLHFKIKSLRVYIASVHFTSLHFTSKQNHFAYISRQFTSLHFKTKSLRVYIASVHFTSLHFKTKSLRMYIASVHFTSLHLFTLSPHLKSLACNYCERSVNTDGGDSPQN
jgi:hypothetical protein